MGRILRQFGLHQGPPKAPRTLPPCMIASLALALPAGCERESRPELKDAEDRPNILVYMVDTLRADELGCYGSPVTKTPAIDAFAGQGTLFTNASATAPATRASVASFMTGVPPAVHGSEHARKFLSEDTNALTRLPEILKEAGYHTAAIVANPNVASVFGFAKGFDVYTELYAPREGRRTPRSGDLISDASVVAQAVQKFIASVPAGRPWFLYVLSIDPHAPYSPPPPYDSMYDQNVVGRRDGSMRALFRFDTLLKSPNPPSPAALLALYRAEITYVDKHFGAVMKSLEKTGRLDETLVVFTADHGEEFADHGQRGHGKSVFEEVTRLPMILRYPSAFPAKARRDDPVDMLDLSATLVRLAGQTPPDYWVGRDMRKTTDPRPIFTTNRDLSRNQATVRYAGYKMIVDRGKKTTTHYYLPTDPREKRPLQGKTKREADQLLGPLLDDFLEHARRLRSMMVKGDMELRPEDLPEDVLKSLRSLGYVE